MTIPKTIVQTSKEKLPEYVVEMIKKRAPNWEYKHFTDKEILQYFINNPISEFPLIINKFWSLKSGEHKADLFRYYFLYNEGGVYIDSDAMIEDNIENITKEYQFFSVNSYLKGTVFQGFIGCVPKNKIMYEALKDMFDKNPTPLPSVRSGSPLLLRHYITGCKCLKDYADLTVRLLRAISLRNTATIDKFDA
jgi:mannosyltransferase OCH1-like enzyme